MSKNAELFWPFSISYHGKMEYKRMNELIVKIDFVRTLVAYIFLSFLKPPLQELSVSSP